MSHSLFDDGFGHHRCCCFFRLFVFGAQYHVELQPIWMLDCICILLKISHLFSFRHVSTVFWAHFFFWTGQITRFLHFSHIFFFFGFSTFHSHHSFIAVLFLDICLFFYQEFSIIYSQFVDFLMDYLPNKTSGGFVTIHGVLCIFCSYFRPFGSTQWTSIELVCGAQLLSAHLEFYLNIMYYSTHSFMLMIAIKENTYINSNEGKKTNRLPSLAKCSRFLFRSSFLYFLSLKFILVN